MEEFGKSLFAPTGNLIKHEDRVGRAKNVNIYDWLYKKAYKM